MSKTFTDYNETMKNALPVFVEGLEEETNIQAGFVCELFLSEEDLSGEEAKDAKVLVAARNFYRLYVNGELCAHGPARAAKGFLRVDEIPIARFLKTGKNVFAFEVTSYGDPFGGYSNDTVLGKGLLRAAVFVCGKKVFSSPKTFAAIRLKQRDQYAERISHCRQMAENCRLDDTYTAWRTDASLCRDKIGVVDDGSALIGRGSPLPTLEEKRMVRVLSAGCAEIDGSVPFEDNWFEKNIGYYSDLKERPNRDYVQTVEKPFEKGEKCEISGDGSLAIKGKAGGSYYAEFDLGRPELGFTKIELEAEEAGIVDIVHLESHVIWGEKDEVSGGANPVTRLHVPSGKTSFVSMEPALGRYFKVYFRGCGSVKLHGLSLLQYTVPNVRGGSFLCSDDNVNRLFEAAALTFRLNALDIFMDCPERERGGWLCDSYWTGRAERMLLGGHPIERDFLENFLSTDPEDMWRGFFPECYPGTKPNFRECAGITTWSFWLMEELCEYVRETGDLEFAEKYGNRVEAFVEGVKSLIGGTRLLENMPWIFIDWSFSNDGPFTSPVSTAANALAAKMLKDLGKLYGRDDWKALGERMADVLRKAILGDNKKGPAFIPDAFNVENGRLAAKDLHTESCTYLTIWAGIIGPENAPLTVFNAVRAMGPCPEFAPSSRLGRAGLFIGLQYRFDMLAKLGEKERLLSELCTFYGSQLKEGPGTLWENPDIRSTSYCHGFTAYAAVQLMRDVLGLGIPDGTKKTVKIAPNPSGLRWAKGSLMTPDGLITLSWTMKNGKLEKTLSLPEGWKEEN